uniref:Fibrinogen C-terminal domain-containing protein n=1 Tax=Anopheles dirus TaxID=7168 RepID=A0A182N7H3_9DIPT
MMLFLLLALSLSISSGYGEVLQHGGCGFGYEILLAKLVAIEERIIALEQRFEDVPTESTVRKYESLQKNSVTEKEEIYHSTIIPTEFSLYTTTDSITSVESKPPQYPLGIEPTPEQLRYGEDRIYSSCREVPSRVSGTFLIRLTKDDRLMNLLCDMQSVDAGWIVVQNRFNGSESFYRNWKDYETGFGNLNGEFWLGLERISSIVNDGRHWEIMFWLKNYQGLKQYAKFERFSLGNATDGYQIHQMWRYSGNAGDSISRHLGMKFTTYDRDNDLASFNCAKKHRGGWWYHKTCVTSNLNGMYGNTANEQFNSWITMKPIGWGLEATRIMIREVN